MAFLIMMWGAAGKKWILNKSGWNSLHGQSMMIRLDFPAEQTQLKGGLDGNKGLFFRGNPDAQSSDDSAAIYSTMRMIVIVVCDTNTMAF